MKHLNYIWLDILCQCGYFYLNLFLWVYEVKNSRSGTWPPLGNTLGHTLSYQTTIPMKTHSRHILHSGLFLSLNNWLTWPYLFLWVCEVKNAKIDAIYLWYFWTIKFMNLETKRYANTI